MDDNEMAIVDALSVMTDDDERINAYVEQNMQKPMDDADNIDATLFNTVFEREYPRLMEKANQALEDAKHQNAESAISKLVSEGVNIDDALKRGGGRRRRRRSATARKSSSYRHRRTSKNRGTQRKQKRRQRRGSRRAY
jgi:hypothetical protein